MFLRLLAIAIIAVFLLSSRAYAQEEPLTVQRLTCEYRVDPINVDAAPPRLAWVVSSERRGARQTAYQWVAASTLDKLDSGSFDLAESGKVESDNTLNVTYDGPRPATGTVYWKARVWDDSDTASLWSAPARFTYGLAEGDDELSSTQFTYVGMSPEAGDPEFPWLRHGLTLDDLTGVTAVRLHVNSLGFQEVWVNGARIEQGPLMPASSQFNKRSFYLTHDITPYVAEGDNTIGIWLGQGWYYPGLPGVVHEGPLVAAEVEIVTVDGVKRFPFDAEGWKIHASNIRRIGEWHSGRYGGERVDARDYLAGWSTPGFDDSAWAPAAVVDVPEHTVSWQAGQANAIERTLAPHIISFDGKDQWLVDFGTNVSGLFSMRFDDLAPGQRITMIFGDAFVGEEFKDFGQRSVYIGRGEPGETFSNRFNYHAFRYVRIHGLDKRPEADTMSATLVRTDYPVYSTFACSNKLLTEIHDMVHYTLECLSLGSYLVDCPHIERLGYGGDGHASTPTAHTLFGMDPLYTTWLAHWRDCQRPDGGLPHTAPNPYSAGGGPYWCAFSVAAPWSMYVHYDDVRALEVNYPMMQQWLDGYVTKYSREDGLLFGWPDEEYRNWYLGDWARPKRDEGELGRSTHLVNNCVIIECYARMAKIATLLGKAEDAQRYAAKADDMRGKIHAEFWHDGTYADDTQIDLAYPLLTGVVPADLEETVEQRLADNILKQEDGHLSAGLVGVPIVTTALLERGRSDLVFTYTNQTTFPSYGYMIENGATATWEHWGGDRSHIHNCYNGIGVWFYRALAGIRPLEEYPAFKRFVLKPEIVGDLTWARARQNTVRGAIESDWKIEGDTFWWNIRVPANTTAEVHVPGSDVEVTEGVEGVNKLRDEAGFTVYEVTSGRYQFRAKR
ncbi:family 78 glycoside hydrolase catalytic domain [Roseovarius pacificus]|uniref:family 78 glycoside hydrolase catalytic domain n=1 Tax=Roseovarius pacificus TaxID=337701 RepID=UPI002A18A81A|nr:family 78 glycoside hydrolase catalytic domain [Roseovarius pacificus]